jgi:hypothetical protein
MNPHVETIFCDDIREEKTGKISFIGTYSSHLFARDFPITLSKFCINVKVVIPLEYSFEDLVFKVYKDEEEMIQAKADESELEIFFEQAKISNKDKDKENNRIYAFQIRIVVSPFQIENECVLRVHAEIDNEIFCGAGLTLGKAKEVSDSTQK